MNDFVTALEPIGRFISSIGLPVFQMRDFKAVWTGDVTCLEAVGGLLA